MFYLLLLDSSFLDIPKIARQFKLRLFKGWVIVVRDPLLNVGTKKPKIGACLGTKTLKNCQNRHLKPKKGKIGYWPTLFNQPSC